MNCYVHNDVVAVAQCNICGKALCPECSDLFDRPLCPSCVEVNNKKFESNILKTFLIPFITGLFLSVVFFLNIRKTGADIGFFNSLIFAFFIIYSVSSIGFGWITIDRFLPTLNRVVFFNPFFQLFVMMIKLILSIIIGIFATPIYLIKYFLDFKQSRDARRIAEGN